MGAGRFSGSHRGCFLVFAGGILALGSAAFGVQVGNDLWGAPRRWERGMAIGEYSTLNLRTGRLLTEIPLLGWEGRGPSIPFSLFHNQTSDV
jgi:hypothetical protein